MVPWYEEEKKVMELAEFLVHSGEIVSTDELLEYFKHPERYTGVWNIYEKEILGAEPLAINNMKKGPLHGSKRVITAITSVEPCACGAIGHGH